MGTSQTYVTRGNKLHSSQGNQRLICYKWVLFILLINPYVTIQKIVHPVMSPTPSHFITNLANKLKPHQTRNQYLRARLDTCTDANILQASVYKLVLNDPELKDLAPSNLEIGTYTHQYCEDYRIFSFYLVHQDTKMLQEETFYVAKYDGSVLLSCTTTLALGLIQPCTRLDYSPSRVSLITSSLDHPRKT